MLIAVVQAPYVAGKNVEGGVRASVINESRSGTAKAGMLESPLCDEIVASRRQD